jgi:siderophore synthetase component
MTPPDTPPEERTSRAQDVAENAAMETLLNLYLLEGGAWRPMPAAELDDLAGEADTYVAVLPFPDLRAVLLAGVTHLSPTHRHRFSLPAKLAVAGGNPVAAGFETLAGMLADELGDTGQGDELTAGGTRGPDPTALLARVRHSVSAVSGFLAAREDEIDGLWSAEPLSFIDSEQAQLLGHAGHPTPKSRIEMSPEDVDAYAPETAARFALHWLAVDPSLVEHDSAGDAPAPQLAEELLRADPAVDEAALDAALEPLGERMLIPVHPWELAHLRESDPVVAALFEDGTIVDLGALGSPVAPTTSVRTVYNADWPWQLKLSLHVRVSNSLRVNRRRELLRAVEAARLLATEVGEKAAAVAPNLVLLTQPAYLSLRHGGEPINGFSVLLRENRWTQDAAAADVSAVTVLCQHHPHGGRSRLAQIIDALAEREGRDEAEVAREWFARYCDALVVPLIRLYTEVGLTTEPHQQNTLLELEDSWPARGVIREGRIFHREAAHTDLAAALPGIGEDSETKLEEDDAEARLVHYLLLNNALGVISALGVAGLADEAELLRDLRGVLERERERAAEAPYPATVFDRLLDAQTWPVKGNMRTRLEDFDELAGGTANSHVFVSILNPLLVVA